MQWIGLLPGDESSADRVSGRFSAVGSTDLAENARHVMGDRLGADAQGGGDSRIGLACGEETQHFHLALGEAVWITRTRRASMPSGNGQELCFEGSGSLTKELVKNKFPISREFGNGAVVPLG